MGQLLALFKNWEEKHPEYTDVMLCMNSNCIGEINQYNSELSCIEEIFTFGDEGELISFLSE